MQMYLYVCMYVYGTVCMSYIYIYVCVCMHVYAYLCMCVCAHVYSHEYGRVYVYACDYYTYVLCSPKYYMGDSYSKPSYVVSPITETRLSAIWVLTHRPLSSSFLWFISRNPIR